MIKDLVLETHHRGTFVILRAITHAIRMTALLAVMEDQNEGFVALQLYHHDTSRHPPDILDEKGIVIVKEPYLKTTADGQTSIPVGHLSDVIVLHKFDESVLDAWRQSPPGEDKERDPISGECVANTSSSRGSTNSQQLNGMYDTYPKGPRSITNHTASCSKGFQLSPDVPETRSLAFVRALSSQSQLLPSCST